MIRTVTRTTMLLLNRPWKILYLPALLAKVLAVRSLIAVATQKVLSAPAC